MRDLEIRGAGNLLGTRQHGFIAAVGFDLYCKLLQDAVKEVRGEPPEEKPLEVKIELALEAYLPTEYVSDGQTRIAIYQEISSVNSPAGIEEVRNSLVDRFGPLPPSVDSLLLLMQLKMVAAKAKCARVAVTSDSMLSLWFDGDSDSVKERIRPFFEIQERQFEISIDTVTMLKTPLAARLPADQALEILALFEKTALS
jgi:transcription-repair coupling factor (superfamily II helicase)